jgi:hypothetical protein
MFDLEIMLSKGYNEHKLDLTLGDKDIKVHNKSKDPLNTPLIFLLDNNSQKIEQYQDWSKELKEARTFFTIDSALLEIGLLECKLNIKYFGSSNSFTTPKTIDEYTKYINIVSDEYNFFYKAQKYNGRIRGNAKPKSDLFKSLLNHMLYLRDLMEKSIYDESENPRYEEIKHFVNRAKKQTNGKKIINSYSENDIELLTLAFLRVEKGLKTIIYTADSDLINIRDDTIANNLEYGFFNEFRLHKFLDNIKINNTFKGVNLEYINPILKTA